MRKRIFILFACALAGFSPAQIALGALPLISDDADTLGKGKWQLEVSGEQGFDKGTAMGGSGTESTSRSRDLELKTILTYGAADGTDLILTIPYQWRREEWGGNVSRNRGFSDMAFEGKWRFFEKDELELAVKPGLTFPTGDWEKDLGSGKLGFTIFLLATKEVDPWSFNFNAGYIRNENKLDERQDIWHLSLSGQYKLGKSLNLVADFGLERNTDPASDTPPAFALAGIIYTVREGFDVDLGLKYGLNNPETDWTVMAGTTLRF